MLPIIGARCLQRCLWDRAKVGAAGQRRRRAPRVVQLEARGALGVERGHTLDAATAILPLRRWLWGHVK